ncbi:MAG: FKBP-type peptidyl-prolyl cis-trans isomerase [Lachnospiraceae bacterium]|nr:FKBP-type peptidyl-prolyl cis-trans isomerase [Lachnospiraceae bacterium]
MNRKNSILLGVLLGVCAIALCVVLVFFAMNSESSDSETETTTAADAEGTATDSTSDDGSAVSTDDTVYGDGEVTLAEYIGLEVGASEVVVSEDDVQENIDACLEDYATYDTYTEGVTVQEDDIVNIDYVGSVDEGEFDGGSYEGYDLQIGSGSFIDGFEDGLIGAEVGTTVTVTATFYDGYGTTTLTETGEEVDLSNREATFVVTINSLQRPTYPEYNDEFVTTYFSAYDLSTTEEFEDYIEEMLYYNLVLTAVWDEFVEACEVVSYDEDEVNDLLDQTVEYYVSYYAYYGYDFEELVSEYGYTLDEYAELYMLDSVKETVKEKMIIRAIAEAEGIEVTDEVYESEAELYRISYGYDTVEELEEAYTKSEIEFSILYDLVTEFVAQNATVYDDSAETETTTTTVTE